MDHKATVSGAEACGAADRVYLIGYRPKGSLGDIVSMADAARRPPVTATVLPV